MDGGTFTISNGGVFGSLFGTPIINPPQSAILGMHGVFERPVVRNGQVDLHYSCLNSFSPLPFLLIPNLYIFVFGTIINRLRCRW